MKSLSIIIPCYNEYERLYKTLPILKEYCDTHLKDCEIIYVDDGSTDNTLRLLREYKQYNTNINIITYKDNKGKGYAIRQGIREAKKDYILFMDADLATDLKCIKDIISYAKKLESVNKDFIIIGNRELQESKVNAKPMRIFIGRAFNGLQRLILHINVSDTQCGFKLFPKSIIPKLIEDLQIDGWAFDVELLYICKINNIPIESFPVIWRDVVGSKIHPIKDSFKMFKELVHIKRLYG